MLSFIYHVVKRFFQSVLLLIGVLLSGQAWSAFSTPCKLVELAVGSEIYQTQPQRVASLLSPSQLPQAFELTLLERNGAWSTYQTPEVWFNKTNCAPLSKTFEGRSYEFMPVLLNKQTGHNAVVIGSVILKVYRVEHIQAIVARYGFKLFTRLTNSRTVIVDVKPTDSYDRLFERLNNDRDIEFAVPLFSEPRYKYR